MRIADDKRKKSQEKHSPTSPARPNQSEGQSNIPLPHEKDETADGQAGGPHKVMKQAKHDIDRGVVDTDRRSSYGMGDDKGLHKRTRKQ